MKIYVNETSYGDYESLEVLATVVDNPPGIMVDIDENCYFCKKLLISDDVMMLLYAEEVY